MTFNSIWFTLFRTLCRHVSEWARQKKIYDEVRVLAGGVGGTETRCGRSALTIIIRHVFVVLRRVLAGDPLTS